MEITALSLAQKGFGLIAKQSNFIADTAYKANTKRHGLAQKFAGLFSGAAGDYAKTPEGKAQAEAFFDSKELAHVGITAGLVNFFERTGYEEMFFKHLFLEEAFDFEALSKDFGASSPQLAARKKAFLEGFIALLKERLAVTPPFSELLLQKDIRLYTLQTAENTQELVLANEAMISQLEKLEAKSNEQIALLRTLADFESILSSIAISQRKTAEAQEKQTENIQTLLKQRLEKEANANLAKITGDKNRVFQNLFHSPVNISEKYETHHHHHYSDQQSQKDNFLSLHIVCAPKKGLPSKPTIASEYPSHRYHDDATAWQPFENEASIKELVDEFRQKVHYKVRERFWYESPITKEEKPPFSKAISRTVLILDPILLDDKATLKHVGRFFNRDSVGGCLVLLCASASFSLFTYLRKRVAEELDEPYDCFLDYREKYLHFVFPVSTKALFFRSLSNIAILKLKIHAEISGKNPAEQAAARQKFSF